MPFHFKKNMLKWKYLYYKSIAIERKLLKEALKCEEDVQLLEDVIVKDNENLMRVHMYVDDMSCKMVEHLIKKIWSDFELSMVGDVTYFPNFQVNQMKDYTFNSQSIYAISSCTKFCGVTKCSKISSKMVMKMSTSMC